MTVYNLFRYTRLLDLFMELLHFFFILMLFTVNRANTNEIRHHKFVFLYEDFTSYVVSVVVELAQQQSLLVLNDTKDTNLTQRPQQEQTQQLEIARTIHYGVILL